MKKRILNFLKSYNIYYVESGNNVIKGNVNIKCPYCGTDDPSEHLGINLTKGVFCCWKNNIHSGHIGKLVQKLLNCSWDDVKKIIGTDTEIVNVSEFDSLFLDNVEVELKTKKLEFRQEFREIEQSLLTGKFYRYLEFRGYKDIVKLIKKYNIKCVLTGDFANRLIFPIYENKKLMSWIGRSISLDSDLKYMDLDKECSVKYPKECLFNFDKEIRHKDLYLTEGVFDTISIEEIGLGDAISIFTKHITTEQKYLINELQNYYENIYIMLDKDAHMEALQLANELLFIKNISIKELPGSVNDPGELIKYYN